MLTNDKFRPQTEPDKTGQLLATVTWRAGNRTKMDPLARREFDLIGTAAEIGEELGRRLALRDYSGRRSAGRIEITWRLAPTEET